MKTIIFLLLIPFLSFSQDENILFESNKIKVTVEMTLTKEYKRVDYYSTEVKIENKTGGMLYYYQNNISKYGYQSYLGMFDINVLNCVHNNGHTYSIKGNQTEYSRVRSNNITSGIWSSDRNIIGSVFSVNKGVDIRSYEISMDKRIKPIIKPKSEVVTEFFDSIAKALDLN